MRKINDVFENSFTDGIFTALQSADVPWKDDNINTALDCEYHGNISGRKNISPLLDNIVTSEHITSAGKTQVVNVLIAMFGDKWRKLWETLSYEYNPIENYAMTEIMTDDTTVVDFGHVVTKDGTDTTTPNITETLTPGITTTVNADIYGFNSTDETPANKTTQSAQGFNTNTRTGSEEIEYDTSETESGQNTHTRNYQLSRTGNIGVTTSQQMIQSERDLDMWDYFYSVVFPDVDRVLTIQIY